MMRRSVVCHQSLPYISDHTHDIVEIPETPIKVTLPDGKAVDGIAWKTTPYDIAKNISRNLAKEVIVAKVYHSR